MGLSSSLPWSFTIVTIVLILDLEKHFLSLVISRFLFQTVLTPASSSSYNGGGGGSLPLNGDHSTDSPQGFEDGNNSLRGSSSNGGGGSSSSTERGGGRGSQHQHSNNAASATVQRSNSNSNRGECVIQKFWSQRLLFEYLCIA